MNISKSKYCTMALCAAASLTLFSACKDDDDNAPAQPQPQANRIQLLTQANWRIAAMNYDSTGTSSDVDFFAAFDPCDKDDIVKFSSANNTTPAGDFLWTEGPTKCDPANPDTVGAGTWSFVNTEQNRIMVPDPVIGTPRQWEIEELTANSLKLKWVMGTNETFTWNFNR